MHPKGEWSAETDPLHTRTPLSPEQLRDQLADTRQSQPRGARAKAKRRRAMAKSSRRANRLRG